MPGNRSRDPAGHGHMTSMAWSRDHAPRGGGRGVPHPVVPQQCELKDCLSEAFNFFSYQNQTIYSVKYYSYNARWQRRLQEWTHAMDFKHTAQQTHILGPHVYTSNHIPTTHI
jgi:hypothetical protein